MIKLLNVLLLLLNDQGLFCRNTQVLREFARNWLPLLFNAFIATNTQERNSYASAIAAYATIAEPATLSHFFREVIKKLLKVKR